MKRIFLFVVTLLFYVGFIFSNASPVFANTCVGGKICPFGYRDDCPGVGECCIPGVIVQWATTVSCDSPAATANPDTLQCPSGTSRSQCSDQRIGASHCCGSDGSIQQMTLPQFNNTGDGVVGSGEPCQVCPDGYSSSGFACPFGTDRSKSCCKWNGLGSYDVVGRNACSQTDYVSFNLCAQAGDDPECTRCRDQAPPGIWTAIGCITTTKEGITTSAIKLGLGIGGGVVLLMILAASFKLTTSKGDPKATEEAKEMITNAIGGLLFIIFSVVLIRTIGRSLLQIPGF